MYLLGLTHGLLQMFARVLFFALTVPALPTLQDTDIFAIPALVGRCRVLAGITKGPTRLQGASKSVGSWITAQAV